MGSLDIERHARGVVRLVMNHEESGNGLGEAFRGLLLPAFEALFQDRACRVIILASGLKNFSVGGDLSKMDALSEPRLGRERLVSAHRLTRLLLANEKPMVAEVRGHAVGAGAGLVLFCDTIVMGETASIGFPFARVGLAPDFAIGHTLPQRIGHARARQALLYARSFKAPDALAIGLADEIAADNDLPVRVMERACALAEFSSHTAALTKRMLMLADDPHAVLDFEAVAQAACFASEEFREGLAAFREKRKPLFDAGIV